jgi:hypothetical protein
MITLTGETRALSINSSGARYTDYSSLAIPDKGDSSTKYPFFRGQVHRIVLRALT